MTRVTFSAAALLWALGLSSGVAQAQMMLQQPTPTHAGSGHMVRDTSGNVILSALYGGVTKFRASDGAVLWDASPGGYYGQLAIDSSNNVYVSGTKTGTDGQGNAVSLLTLTKISSSGAVLWTAQRNIGLVSEHSSAGPIALGSNGSVYVIGTSGNASQPTAPATLVRFSASNGAVQLPTVALGNVLEYSADMPTDALRVDSSNNVYWASPAGLKRFTSTLGGSTTWSGQIPVRAVAFSGTSVYITGAQPTGSSYQMYVAKLTSSGLATSWKYLFPAQPRTDPYPGLGHVCEPGNYATYGGNALAVDSSGNVYAAGDAVSPNGSFTGGTFAKINSSGQLLWSRQLGFSGLESSCFDTAIGANGKVVVSCADMQLYNGSSTATAAIYDQNGNQLQSFSNDGPGGVSDAFDHLLIGASGTLYLLDESGYWGDPNATWEYYVPTIMVYTQTGL